MKLGEIKLEALYLCFATPELCIDTENTDVLSDTLFNLKNDSNYKDYLNASVGAINRCFSYIESKGLVPKRTLNVPKEKMILRNGMCIIDLSDIEDSVLSVDGVYKSDASVLYDPIEFIHLDKEIRISPVYYGCTHTVIYTPRIPRISHKTEESYNIPLPEEISNIIPYFVKGDIFALDDLEEAKRATDCFTSACKSFCNSIAVFPSSVRQVYSMEG